jgi:hypothetical protein
MVQEWFLWHNKFIIRVILGLLQLDFFFRSTTVGTQTGTVRLKQNNY